MKRCLDIKTPLAGGGFSSPVAREAPRAKPYYPALALSQREQPFPLNDLLCHHIRNVVRLPDRQRDDSQSRILGAARGELAAVGNKQIRDIVGLPEFVDDAVARLFAHPAG